MCNLYALRRSRQEVTQTFGVERDRVPDWAERTAIRPDGVAPVVRMAEDGVREMVEMRWGFPPWQGKALLTNARNLASPYWRPWIGHRCLVPVSSFTEYTDTLPKVAHWFALSDERPLMAFAGFWRTWEGTRGTKANPATGTHSLFAFATTAPNAVVGPIHSKAMPVLLATDEDRELWLTAPKEVALSLQAPAPDDLIQVVATGGRSD